MTVETYYSPLRTHILASEGMIGHVSRDLLDHGLHDCLCSLSTDNQLAEIMDAFEPVEGCEGTYLFQDVTATCGTDWNDAWLDSSAQRMLDNALPGSYFEVADTGKLTAHRFERGKKRESRKMANPFVEEAVRMPEQAAGKAGGLVAGAESPTGIAVPVNFIPQLWDTRGCAEDADGTGFGTEKTSRVEFDAAPVLDGFGAAELDALAGNRNLRDALVYKAQVLHLLPQWSGPFRIELPDPEAYSRYVSGRRGA